MVVTCQGIKGRWIRSNEMKMIKETIDCYRAGKL